MLQQLPNAHHFLDLWDLVGGLVVGDNALDAVVLESNAAQALGEVVQVDELLVITDRV